MGKKCLPTTEIINLPILDRIKFLNRSSRKVIELLLSGGKFSNVQITEKTKVSDSRSCIRYIRAFGIPVADYWVRTSETRYKVYFFHNSKGGVE